MVPKPDSGYSWVVAFCCSYIHFALFGLFRCAGVMYVAMLETYHVPREQASWPFSICSGVFQLIAPATTLLTRHLSLRQTALLGSSIATVGMAGCFFADGITGINVSYGVVHGIGFGICVTIIPVLLNQYFVAHRSTAMGIAFAGGTLSSMIFPVVMEWLLYTYSLRESFLILGGVVMNMLVASSLLRTPPWIQKQKLARDVSEGKDSGVSVDCNRGDVYAVVSTIDDKADDVNQNNDNDAGDSAETTLTHNTIRSNDSVLFGGSNGKLNVISALETNHKDSNEAQKPLMNGDKVFVIPAKAIEQRRYSYSTRRSMTYILKQPIFYLITFTLVAYFLSTHSLFIVVVDFAKDKGILEADAVYIVSIFSVTDMVGRAGLGWVTDKNFIGRKKMIALNLAVIGVLYNIYPFVMSLTGMLVVAAFNGIAVGSSITLFFIVEADSLGAENLTLVIGMVSFINGIMSFLRPAIIGMFRDVVGSYDWMFRCNGMLLLFFSSLWIIEICLSKKKEGEIQKNEKV